MIKVIWSQDELLATEAVEEASARIGASGEVLTIDAEIGIDGLEEALFAGSLFATERLVVVRNAQTLKKTGIERLSDALHQETVPADVIVVATSERVATPIIDALKDVGEVTRLQRPRRGELMNWVIKRFKRSGIEAGRDVAPALVDAFGDNLRDIAQGIDQLALRAKGKGGRVERADVLEHFAPQSEQPIWVLFDAIVKHEGLKAFETLQRLLVHDDPLPMLGAIVSQIRGIIRTKSLIERNPQLRDGEIAKALGVSEGRAAVMRRQCGRLTWDWLLSVHKMCAQADFELKGGEDGAVLPAEIVLERVVAGALDAS